MTRVRNNRRFLSILLCAAVVSGTLFSGLSNAGAAYAVDPESIPPISGPAGLYDPAENPAPENLKGGSAGSTEMPVQERQDEQDASTERERPTFKELLEGHELPLAGNPVAGSYVTTSGVLMDLDDNGVYSWDETGVGGNRITGTYTVKRQIDSFKSLKINQKILGQSM